MGVRTASMISASGKARDDAMSPRVAYGGRVDFMFITLGAIGLIVLCLVLIARAYPGSGADLVDWKPTRSPEVEAQLEIDDVQQMIAAQNEYRRRRGAPDLTEDDANQMAREDEAIRERARRSHEARLDELEDEYGV
jgi:hypothetical protein